MTQASCPMSSIGTVSFCSFVSWQKFPMNEWTIFTHVCSLKTLWFTGAIYGMRVRFSVLTTKGVKNGSMTGFMSSVILVQLFWKSLSFFWSDDSVLCGDLFYSRKWIGKKSEEKKINKFQNGKYCFKLTVVVCSGVLFLLGVVQFPLMSSSTISSLCNCLKEKLRWDDN